MTGLLEYSPQPRGSGEQCNSATKISWYSDYREVEETRSGLEDGYRCARRAVRVVKGRDFPMRRDGLVILVAGLGSPDVNSMLFDNKSRY
jgi:hypothetical protein